jgi:hypothetical protein
MTTGQLESEAGRSLLAGCIKFPEADYLVMYPLLALTASPRASTQQQRQVKPCCNELPGTVTGHCALYFYLTLYQLVTQYGFE